MKKAKKMAPKVGLEPTTNRLTAGCSTTELLRNIIIYLCLPCTFIIITIAKKYTSIFLKIPKDFSKFYAPYFIQNLYK